MIKSDIEFDKKRCQRCGRLLSENFGGKKLRRTLREWDGDVVFATMVDIRCANCGRVNEIFYQADMLPPAARKKGLFACVPAV